MKLIGNKRRPLGRKESKNKFKHTADRTHKFNNANYRPSWMRGGIRL